MKKFLTNVSLFLTAFVISISSSVRAQQPAPDLSMLTNHASLVNYAFKQVQGIAINPGSGGDAANYSHRTFIAFTNQIKTLDTIQPIVSQYSWALQLAHSNDYVSLYVELINTNVDPQTIYAPDSYDVFVGYGGGQPTKTPYGYSILSPDASAVQMQIGSTIRIPVPGLYDARLITSDAYGNANGHGLSVQNAGSANAQLVFESDYAGSGEIVLSTEFQLPNGNWTSSQTAYSLTNTAPLPLTWVYLGVLLRDSDDFKSFVDPQAMDVSVYSWQGYGKVPLLTSTFNKDLAKGVTISVHSIDGQYATGYIIENLGTGVKTTVKVPQGATSLKYDFTGGTYSIIPLGINLQSYQQYYSYYYGKG